MYHLFSSLYREHVSVTVLPLVDKGRLLRVKTLENAYYLAS